MRKYLLSTIVFFLCVAEAHGLQSMIAETEGKACVSAGISKEQAQDRAIKKAEDNARENVLNYFRTTIKNQSELAETVRSYTNSTVKVVQEIRKGWDNDQACFLAYLQTEVIPNSNPAVAGRSTRGIKVMHSEETSAPPVSISSQLQIQAWTDKSGYREGQKITLYVRGSRAFYARIVYRDAGGNTIQLLPNPYRQDNHFDAGAINQIPSGSDKFELEVTPPFGTEEVVVYGSTAPLGEIDIKPAGGVYEIRLAHTEIGVKTRGIGVRVGRPPAPHQTAMAKDTLHRQSAHKQSVQTNTIAEFAETSVIIKTSK